MRDGRQKSKSAENWESKTAHILGVDVATPTQGGFCNLLMTILASNDKNRVSKAIPDVYWDSFLK